MPSSMPRKWMKRSKFGLAALLIGSAAIASPFEEPHLNIVPRTKAEAARIKAVTALTSDFGKAQAFEANSGGGATVRVLPDTNAFSQPSGNISFEDELTFQVGNGLFRKLWVSSPSSTLASDGLGPLYNARSCQRCHIKDGRGHPPKSGDDTPISMILRLSIPSDDAFMEDRIKGYIATRPEPTMAHSCRISAWPGIPQSTA